MYSNLRMHKKEGTAWALTTKSFLVFFVLVYLKQIEGKRNNDGV